MQLKLHMVTIEDLVPEGHFLRKPEATLDLSFVREETAHLYSPRYEMCIRDRYWAGSRRLARRQRIFIVADFRGRRAADILFKPRPMLPLPPPCREGGRTAAEGDRTSSFETGRQIPVIHPFQCFRMRGAAKRQEETAFRNSFGLPTDPFPTLLASDVTPFAFWYEGDPDGGCIRFLTETESERLMGLPEGWTKYGADGMEIRPLQRYKALGNAIALPCADYIMAGIYEVLADRVGKEE